jgi:hypothetical protein
MSTSTVYDHPGLLLCTAHRCRRDIYCTLQNVETKGRDETCGDVGGRYSVPSLCVHTLVRLSLSLQGNILVRTPRPFYPPSFREEAHVLRSSFTGPRSSVCLLMLCSTVSVSAMMCIGITRSWYSQPRQTAEIARTTENDTSGSIRTCSSRRILRTSTSCKSTTITKNSLHDRVLRKGPYQ